MVYNVYLRAILRPLAILILLYSFLLVLISLWYSAYILNYILVLTTWGAPYRNAAPFAAIIIDGTSLHVLPMHQRSAGGLRFRHG